MHKRLLGALLWLALLPIVGSGRLLWHLLHLLAALRPKTMLILVGLAMSLSLPNPVSAQLAQVGSSPLGRMILTRGLLSLGTAVLYHGLRSPGLARLRRRLLAMSR
jgi:hypothetical protein